MKKTIVMLGVMTMCIASCEKEGDTFTADMAWKNEKEIALE